MIIELIRKEFIKNRGTKVRNKWISFLKGCAYVLFFAVFVAFECFIFTSLDKKISAYSDGGTFHFLVFFLAIIFIISILSTSISARSTIFDEADKRIIASLPISSDEIIISKMISIYLKQTLLQLLTTTPLLVCYAMVRRMLPYFYVFTFLFPFVISLLTVGIGLLLVIVIEIIYRLIKNRDVLQIILASIAVISLCYVYQYLLQLFLDALNDSQIGGVFSPEFINFLTTSSKFMFPIYNVLEAVLLKQNIIANMCFFAGTILVSLALSFIVVGYAHKKFVKSTTVHVLKKYQQRNMLKITTPFKALLIKEMDLLFKNSTYLLSYTSLLIMCPFLSFVVISSLNSIVYSNLTFYASYFPEIINCINICLILLFSSVINSAAVKSITREDKSLQIIKYIPVHAYKQLLAKIAIPFFFSTGSLLITLVVLLTTNTISLTAFLVSLMVGMSLILVNNILGVLFDMHDKKVVKIKLVPFLRIISLGTPLVLFVIQFLLSISKTPTWAMYLIIVALDFSFLGVMLIRIRKRLINAFRKMEAN